MKQATINSKLKKQLWFVSPLIIGVLFISFMGVFYSKQVNADTPAAPDITRSTLSSNITTILNQLLTFFTTQAAIPAPNQTTASNNSSNLATNTTPSITDPNTNLTISKESALINDLHNQGLLLELYGETVADPVYGQVMPSAPSSVNNNPDFATQAVSTHAVTYCPLMSSIVSNAWNSVCSSNNGPHIQFGDVKVSSLLSNINFKTSAVAQQAAKDFLTNLSGPLPNTDLNQTLSQYTAGMKMVQQANKTTGAKDNVPTAFTPDDLKKWAQNLGMQASGSVARHSFYKMYADRIPDENGNSLLQIMENEVKSRFTNAAWYQSLTTASQESLLREMAQMDAFKIWLQYQQFRQGERMEALLATQLNTLINLQSQLNSKMNATTYPGNN